MNPKYTHSTPNPQPKIPNPQPTILKTRYREVDDKYAILQQQVEAIASGKWCGTLHPQPSTLNPQPSTLNPQPSTLNPQPSTFNPQPSTPNARHGAEHRYRKHHLHRDAYKKVNFTSTQEPWRRLPKVN
jgi:hypothetical protein